MCKYYSCHFTLFVNVNCFYFLKPLIKPDIHISIMCEQASFHGREERLVAGIMETEAPPHLWPLCCGKLWKRELKVPSVS